MNKVKVRLFLENFRRANNCKECRGMCSFGTAPLSTASKYLSSSSIWKEAYDRVNKTTMKCPWRHRNEQG